MRKNGLFRQNEDARINGLYVLNHSAYKCLEGLLYIALIARLVGMKPLPLIVGGQFCEKLKGVFGKHVVDSISRSRILSGLQYVLYGKRDIGKKVVAGSDFNLVDGGAVVAPMQVGGYVFIGNNHGNEPGIFP
jgi:hypothetical protein